MKRRTLKIIAAILCSSVLFGMTSCGVVKTEAEPDAPSETAETSGELQPLEDDETVDAEAGETPEEAAPDTVKTEEEEVQESVEEPAEQAEEESHYVFRPYVSSSIMNEIMGQEMFDTYCRFVDAVLAGETSFACPDQDTYLWVMGQYAYLLFPVVDIYTSIPYEGVSYEDGTGYFQYTIPYGDFRQKLQEFEDIVTGILNETLKGDYSDLEKALALYVYFTDHYTYDYETYERSGYESVLDMLSGYRLLTERTGICQEISVAYSYLLLEAGVDATVMKGVREWDGEHHQWSYVTIDGKNYHVDPTYAISDGLCSLSFFMMTDEERYLEDGYNPDNWVLSTVYYQLYEHGDYAADDDRYRELWGQYLTYLDTDENRIEYIDSSFEERGFFNYGDS